MFDQSCITNAVLPQRHLRQLTCPSSSSLAANHPQAAGKTALYCSAQQGTSIFLIKIAFKHHLQIWMRPCARHFVNSTSWQQYRNICFLRVYIEILKYLMCFPPLSLSLPLFSSTPTPSFTDGISCLHASPSAPPPPGHRRQQ